jgi:E3 ubiquitin-protein ligase UBR1
MRRGRRQHLHLPRLEDLRKTWVNHKIPVFVARKMDQVIDSGGWDTL